MEENEVVTVQNKEKKVRKHSVFGSGFMKALFFLLVILSLVVGIASAAGTYYLVTNEVYTENFSEILKKSLYADSNHIAENVSDYLFRQKYDSAVDYLHTINAEVAILDPDNKYAKDDSVFLWQSYAKTEPTGFYSTLYVDIEDQYYFYGHGSTAKHYIYRVFYDPMFTLQDASRTTMERTWLLYQYRYAFPIALGCSILIFLLGMAFLLRSVGHRNGREGIVPSFITYIPIDLLTVVLIIFPVFIGKASGLISHSVLSILFFVGYTILLLIYLLDIVVRIKMGAWWRNSVIYKFFSFLGRICIGFLRRCRELARMTTRKSAVIEIVAIFLFTCIMEAISIILIMAESHNFLLVWMLIKLFEAIGIMYLALLWQELLAAGKQLADGKENYRVNTSRMILGFKEHADNLNSIGTGITKAVEARMKSERMKTELITNVSHDIKTPLTSIINYADLIGKESAGNPQLTEYTEVLERQSKRLKKLLEDLVEASKATTGNIEMESVPCEVGVLLTQAVGEYQQKMDEKGLDVRVTKPQQEVRILADGRHLWRIFDNLLNNICKYAQENTRVFLNLEQKDDRVLITFRNMSKYLLDVTPDELEERFGRGDKSRHMEGNGLGLSIAKNLTEIQNGKFDIVLDGDLFKVVLDFPVLSE